MFHMNPEEFCVSDLLSCSRTLECLSGSSAGWWASTAAPSAMAARLSIWRRPSSGVVFARSPLSTSAGAGGWPTACCGEKAGR